MQPQLNDFDPNNPKKTNHLWATYIPYRYPQFKTHTKRAHASLALVNASHTFRDAIMYEYVDNKWVERDRMESPEACDWCGGTLMFTQERWGKEYTYKICRRLDKHSARPSYKKPIVCQACYTKHFQYKAPEPLEHTIVRNRHANAHGIKHQPEG